MEKQKIVEQVENIEDTKEVIVPDENDSSGLLGTCKVVVSQYWY